MSMWWSLFSPEWERYSLCMWERLRWIYMLNVAVSVLGHENMFWFQCVYVWKWVYLEIFSLFVCLMSFFMCLNFLAPDIRSRHWLHQWTCFSKNRLFSTWVPSQISYDVIIAPVSSIIQKYDETVTIVLSPFSNGKQVLQKRDRSWMKTCCYK